MNPIQPCEIFKTRVSLLLHDFLETKKRKLANLHINLIYVFETIERENETKNAAVLRRGCHESIEEEGEAMLHLLPPPHRYPVFHLLLLVVVVV